jgi:ABC-type bacteriocin/lantibiotic exporter with double-glycine peptidase domain
VVYRVKGDAFGGLRQRIRIADPAVGRRSLNAGEFHSSWTGYALLTMNSLRFKVFITTWRSSSGIFKQKSPINFRLFA